MLKQSFVIFRLDIVTSLDFDQSSALNHRPIRIRHVQKLKHICLSKQSIALRVDQADLSRVIHKIFMIHIVPILESIFQQIATTIQPYRIQSSLVLQLLLAKYIWAYRFIIEQKGIFLCRRVWYWVQRKKALVSGLILLSNGESCVDQSYSRYRGIDGRARRKERSSQIAPIAKSYNLICIILGNYVELIRLRA